MPVSKQKGGCSSGLGKKATDESLLESDSEEK